MKYKGIIIATLIWGAISLATLSVVMPWYDAIVNAIWGMIGFIAIVLFVRFLLYSFQREHERPSREIRNRAYHEEMGRQAARDDYRKRSR